MRRHVDGHIQIARRPAPASGAALPRNPDLRVVANARRNRHGHLTGARDSASAAASRAAAGVQRTRAIAALAAPREDHVSARSAEAADTVARRALHGGNRQRPRARALAARRLADDRQMEPPAGGGLLERQRQRLVHVTPALLWTG